MEIINNILKEKGHKDLAELFKNARFEIEITSTYGRRLFSQLSSAEIFLPKDVHAKAVTLSEEKRNIILSAFLDAYPVKDHSPEICEVNFNFDPSLSASKLEISLEIRQKLIDELILFEEKYRSGIPGKLDWPEFLNRIWPLNQMNSTDHRFKTAYSDLWQHTVNNSDYNTHYILCGYFDLLNAEDEKFICFLEQLVHPIIRTPEEQSEYVSLVNRSISLSDYQLAIQEQSSNFPFYTMVKKTVGVNQRVKNIIFAAIGEKPEIIFTDSISNDIKIVKNEDLCLIYDQSIPDTGLLWADIVAWYQATLKSNESFNEIQRKLYSRLMQSLASEPEKTLFSTYYKTFWKISNGEIPALIPQVYLHYDPYSLKQLRGESRLFRQRMDFLMLFSNRQRIIIEVDGIQHYADKNETGKNIASPKKYGDTVKEDRKLRLAGYEIYRFGGYELYDKKQGEILVKKFFNELFRKYGMNQLQAI